MRGTKIQQIVVRCGLWASGYFYFTELHREEKKFTEKNDGFYSVVKDY